MKYLLTGVILIFTISCIGQTVVLIYKTKNKIVLAADTRVRNTTTISGIFGSSTVVIDTFRKIGGYRDMYFGISGRYIRPMFNEAEKACKATKAIDSVALLFFQNATKILFDSLQRVREVNRNLFNTEYKNKLAVGVIFCTVRRDTAIFIRLLITPIETAEGLTFEPAVTTSFEYDDTCATGMGHLTALNDSLPLPETWKNKDPIKTAIRLIKKQSKDTPDFVAPPVDVLILTKKQHSLKRYN